jgi:hypothetical protein
MSTDNKAGITMNLPDAPATSSIRPRPRRSKRTTTGVPYASASSGTKARDEIIKWLRRLGCEQIGFMDKFEQHELLLAFVHRGRPVQITVSAKGWAQMYLKENPWSYRHRTHRVEYEQAALAQGQIAVNSIMRDWIKGQITAIESGILSFEAVFMPYMLTDDGRTVMEHAAEFLSKPDQPKVLALPTP